MKKGFWGYFKRGILLCFIGSYALLGTMEQMSVIVRAETVGEEMAVSESGEELVALIQEAIAESEEELLTQEAIAENEEESALVTDNEAAVGEETGEAGSEAADTAESEQSVEDESALNETSMLLSEIDNEGITTTQTGSETVTFTTENGVTSAAFSQEGEAITAQTDSETGVVTVTIGTAGEYTLTGSAVNTIIAVAKGLTGVTLNFNAFNIDDSALCSKTGSDSPVLSIGKGSAVTINMTGESLLKGSSTFAEEPAPIIKAPSATLTFEGAGSLTVTDAMPTDTTFTYNGENVDPADGISAKEGTVNFTSGTVNVANVNGSAVKAKQGTINVNGGTLNTSYTCDDAVKAKDGTINITSGTVNISYSYGDGLKAKMEDVPTGGNINISGGTVNITEEIYGDGIQGENVNISDGTVDIKTVFDNAAEQYYTSGSTSTSLNTITEVNDTCKTERINVDTGDHSGIKAGTKESTRIFSGLLTTDPGNAIKTYSASGGLTISGGTVNINTLGAGLKANKASGYTACSNGQYIIGSPDDGLHSNNNLVIRGGTITINSSDDGITAAGDVTITGSDTKVDIQNSFEGIEGSNIIFGTSGASDGPTVTIVSDDDGINAAHKSGVTYTYDGSEETDSGYTKTTVKAEGNSCVVYSGAVTIKIDTASTKSRTLRNGSASSTKDVNYTADGDGIDCNGTLELAGGMTTVFGASPSTSNSPIDTDGGFTLGENARLLATGSDGMGESVPEYGSGYYIIYGSSGQSGQGGSNPGGTGGQGGFNPGGQSGSGAFGQDELSSESVDDLAAPGEQGPGGGNNPGGGSTASISANSSFKVVAGNDTLIDTTLPYAASFLIYADPALAESNTVTIGSTQTTLTRSQASGTNSGTTISSVSVSPASQTLNVGENATLTATVNTSSAGQQGPGGQGDPGSSSSVIWTTSDSSVATVAAISTTTAKVYGLKAGTATITATSASDSTKSGTCTVTVAASTILTLDRSSLEMDIAEEAATLTATVTTLGGTAPDVTWTSSDTTESVIRITPSGTRNATLTVTPVAKGTATITAFANDASATCMVTVIDKVSASGLDSKVNPEETIISEEDAKKGITKAYTADMVKGQTDTLSAGEWTSGDPKTVSVVKKTGKITAKKAGGPVTLTNTLTDGTKITYAITVYEPSLTLNSNASLNGKSKTLLVGNAYENALTLKVGTPSLPVAWISSNPAVVSVTGDQYGTSDGTGIFAKADLKAVGTGNAKLSAYVGGKAYSVSVSVKDLPTFSKLSDGADVTLCAMQSFTPSFNRDFNIKQAEWYFEGKKLTQDAAGTWTDAGKHISITAKGKITGLKAADEPLTLKAASEGETLELNFTIKATPVKTDLYLNVGQKVNLKHRYVTNKNITGWTSDSGEEGRGTIALLNQQNKAGASLSLEGKAAGDVTLSCTCNDEKCGEVVYVTTVHVEDPSLTTDSKLTPLKPDTLNYTLTLSNEEKYTIVQPRVSQKVTWMSSAKARVFVDENGVIHARQKGKANIKAKVSNKIVNIAVTVN
ncbi:MAG: carbohydrate-binding domain-containing protein [Lachnospiraceae bacterium]|nr:carbohydrate-binding domain-containing protein [Lachnospiraceae bacterium]